MGWAVVALLFLNFSPTNAATSSSSVAVSTRCDFGAGESPLWQSCDCIRVPSSPSDETVATSSSLSSSPLWEVRCHDVEWPHLPPLPSAPPPPSAQNAYAKLDSDLEGSGSGSRELSQDQLLFRLVDRSAVKKAVARGRFSGSERAGSSLVSLSVSGSPELDALRQDGFRAQPRLHTLDLSRNAISAINVNAFRGLEDGLRRLVLSHNNVSLLPTWSFTYLRALQHLHLEHNRLAWIRPSAFVETQLDRLHYLHLDYNELVELPSLSLHRLPLLVLTAAGNRIERVERGALPPTLIHADFRDNRMQKVPLAALVGLDSLQTLDLRGNNISALSEERGVRLDGADELSILVANNCLRRFAARSLASTPKLDRLDLSQNQIEWLDDRALEGVTRLRRLDLSSNSIQSLPAHLFDGVSSSLIELNLGDNRLSRVASIAVLAHLRVLQLAGNSIVDLDASVFAMMRTSLETISLAHNLLESVPADALRPLRALKDVDLSYNRISRIQSRDFLPPADVANLSSIVKLNLAGNVLTGLDASILSALTSLSHLDLSHNRLDRLDSAALRGLARLDTLLLHSNALSDFPSDVLVETGADNLRSLALDDNQIGELPDLLLRSLPNLERLHLAGNGLARLKASIFHASTTRQLQSLVLSRNRLLLIDPYAFHQLPRLEQLALAENELDVVVEKTFASLPSLRHLDLSDNRISILHPAALIDLPRLDSLSLRQNRLERLDGRSFVSLPRLRWLSLSQNRLRHVECSAFGSSRVSHLDLSYNNLTALDVSCVGDSLRFLSLAHNPLVVLDKHIFQSAERLEDVDLSNCQLLELPDTLLSFAHRLSRLSVAHNSLRRLGRHSFGNQSRLQSLDLAYNYISTLVADTFGEDNVQSLNLANNLLGAVPAGGLASTASSLRHLDLSGNKIAVIQSAAFSRFSHLQSLVLARNSIESVEEGAFSGALRLRHLDLSDNPIASWSPNAFRELSPLLAHLNLAGTALYSLPRVPAPMLVSLNVSRNRLTSLAEEDVTAFGATLESLDLSGNRLDDLDDRLFRGLPRLRHLNLSSLPLTRLDGRLFEHLSHLESFVFNDASSLVDALPASHFWRKLHNLKALELSGLPITSDAIHFSASSLLSALPPLHSLHLQWPDTSVDQHFRNVDLRSLRHLTLSGETLRRLEPSAFSLLRGHHFALTLRNTSVTSFPSSILSSIRGVRLLSLHLDDNLLQGFDPFSGASARVPVLNAHGTVLQVTTLSGNPLACDCRLAWLEPWWRSARSRLAPDELGTIEDRLLGARCAENGETLRSVYLQSTLFRHCRKSFATSDYARSAGSLTTSSSIVLLFWLITSVLFLV